MKSKTFLLVSFIAVAGLIAIVVLLKDDIFSLRLYSPPSWMGIVPGETSLADVESILGLPDKQMERNTFQIYGYQEREVLGWKTVEIWLDTRFSQPEISAILLSIPYETDDTSIYSLESLLDQFGKPNFITWSTYPLERYLSWSNRGVAINVWLYPGYQVNAPEIQKMTTQSILLFQPMSTFRLKGMDWPWGVHAGWTFANMYPKQQSRTPDEYPKDPFDWSKLIP